MNERDPLASRRPGDVPGKIGKAFVGRFSKWIEGEPVRIWINEDGTVTVERVDWTISRVPLVNSCSQVPAQCVVFDK